MDGNNKINLKNHKETKAFEAYCIGMQIDYSLIYPNGIIKNVEFKTNNMTAIIELDQKIDKIQLQMTFLSKDKIISSKAKSELRQYYENKISSYTAQKESLIKEIEVNAEVLNPKE